MKEESWGKSEKQCSLPPIIWTVLLDVSVKKMADSYLDLKTDQWALNEELMKAI